MFHTLARLKKGGSEKSVFFVFLHFAKSVLSRVSLQKSKYCPTQPARKLSKSGRSEPCEPCDANDAPNLTLTTYSCTPLLSHTHTHGFLNDAR